MNTLKENKSTSQKKRYLKTGDLVLLFSDEAEEEGYIAIGGNTDDRCIIKPFKDKGLKLLGNLSPSNLLF
jgi:hypothetical protein